MHISGFAARVRGSSHSTGALGDFREFRELITLHGENNRLSANDSFAVMLPEAGDHFALPSDFSPL
jgi:hypothetical protein